MAALGIGSHANVSIPNVLIEQVTSDASYVLVRLPDDASGIPLEYWIPASDSRISIQAIVPANWPPKEGDVWIVPGVTPAAFVVADTSGGMYFLTTDAIRAVYAGNTTLPTTTDQALAAYGSALTLLYRHA